MVGLNITVLRHLEFRTSFILLMYVNCFSMSSRMASICGLLLRLANMFLSLTISSLIQSISFSRLTFCSSVRFSQLHREKLNWGRMLTEMLCSCLLSLLIEFSSINTFSVSLLLSANCLVNSSRFNDIFVTLSSNIFCCFLSKLSYVCRL